MNQAPETYHISPETDLARFLDQLGEDTVLMTDQAHFRVTRVETVPPRRRRSGTQPERVLNIIGVGNSGGGDIARFKDDYIADAIQGGRQTS
jgi:hypothetical protein